MKHIKLQITFTTDRKVLKVSQLNKFILNYKLHNTHTTYNSPARIISTY